MGQQSQGFYVEQGAKRAVVGSGGSLDVKSGGELDIESGGALKLAGTAVTATAAEINELAAQISDFTFAAASAGTNIAEVTITAKQADGTTTVASPVIFHLWLSDAATGAGLTGTAASGTVTVKSASGAVIGTLTSKKALVVQALATGVFILEITDSSKTAYYVCAQTPHGETKIATVLATGDYG